MKNSAYGKLSKRKLFEKNDLFLYVFLLVLVVGIFLAVLLSPKQSSFGFNVSVDGKTAVTVKYVDNSVKVNEEFISLVEIDQASLRITIYFGEDKTHFNVIEYSTKEKWVKVSESNCSTSKECVNSPAITSSFGAIVCAPHKLKIASVNGENSFYPITGA